MESINYGVIVVGSNKLANSWSADVRFSTEIN